MTDSENLYEPLIPAVPPIPVLSHAEAKVADTNNAQPEFAPVPPEEYRAEIRDPEVRAIVNTMQPSDTDPNGSYTGQPVCDDEVPTQDADDL